jgi:UDP-N-acetylmuramoylalanine--D-glutamate ligase
MKLSELKNYNNKKVAILGYWKEGKSTLDFLMKLKFENITVIDKNEETKKQEKINYNLWNKYLENLDKFDLIFISPWISPYSNEIALYRNKLITQAQIFFDNYKGKIIWITWTKGKSTISTITYKLLNNIWYKTKLVWNIWNPVLSEIDIIWNEKYDFIVYELSSYMLEYIKPKLYIWILNNIFKCHLNWHNWIENYREAKFNILNNSKYKLLNYDLKNKNSLKQDKNLFYFWKKWNYTYKKWLFYIGEHRILKIKNIALQWEHNMYNISAIIWILDIINKKNSSHNIIELEKLLTSFTWLSHRLENIWTYKWITFIDDANSWTPESTIAAIKTYKEKIWTIFLWWQDWDFTYLKLIKLLEQYNIKNIVLFPETWEKIFWDISNYNYDEEFILPWNYSPKILKTKSMKNAVDFGFKNTEKWKICLLSCAAASYSLWKSFEEKWDLFKEEIKKHNIK